MRRQEPGESAQKARVVSCGTSKTASDVKLLAGLECAQLGKRHCVDAVDRAAVAGLVKVRVIILM